MSLRKKTFLAGVAAVIAINSAAAFATPTITLGLSDWPGWVAWYVAEHNGYFKKYGAHFKPVWFTSYMISVEALSAGKIDSAFTTETLPRDEQGLVVESDMKVVNLVESIRDRIRNTTTQLSDDDLLERVAS